MLKNNEKVMDKIVDLCKSKGFVYPGSEIYGGLANTWDYGPLGVELKKNIKNAWMKKFVQENKYNVGLDSAILMNPQTWVASGHIGGFSDPLMDCKECKTRHRADNLIEDFDGTNVAGWSNEQMMDYIKEKNIVCPNCGKQNFTDIRQFNLMFKTFQGVTEDSKAELYLRPETAQGIFVNFANIQRTTRKKVPFGVAQVGKSFRNEITPGNFIFRADGARVLLQAGHRPRMVRLLEKLLQELPPQPRSQGGEYPPPRPLARGALLLLQGYDRLRVPLPVRLG